MSKRIRGSFQVDKDLNLSNSTANRALTTDASKNLVPSATTDTQVGYLSTSTGVTGSQNVVLSNNSTLTGVTIADEVRTPLVTSADAAGTTADIDIATGTSSGAASGPIYVETGNGVTGTGFVAIATGDASGGDTGEIIMQTGATPSDDSGNISLLTGVAGAGNSGNIILSTGSAGVTQGSIQLTAPTVTASNHLNVTGTLKTNTIDTPSAGTLAIGTSVATTVNIGKSGGTVNINGAVLYENVTQLQVTDPLITINKGGGAGSASNSGIEIEENSSITGYVETSGDRNSWIMKAPNTAGVVTVTPGASGFTLNQSSHDPVTLGTANGLSLSTQQLSMDLSSGSTTGTLSSSDWTAFNNKANNTLNNLGTTSVNADIVWGADNTRSLGSDANEANSLWAFNVKHNDSGTPDLKLSVTGNSGNIVLDSHGQSTQQFSTSNSVLFSTNVLTGGIAAGTAPNNSASDTLSGVSLGTTSSPFVSVVSPQYLAPNTVVSKSGLSYSSGVTTISISDTSNLLVGMSVNGTGIQDGTIITSVTTNTSININLSTNAVGSSTTLNFVSALTTRTPDVSSGSNFTGNATFRSGNTVDGLSGQVTVRSGDVSGTGRSASTTLRSGNHTNTSNTSTTGGITVRSGDHSGTGSASSGSVTVRSGTVAGTTSSGSTTISTGASSGTGASGAFTAGSGNNTSTGVSGNVTLTSGTTTSVTSGTIFVASGAPTGSGNSGSVATRSGTVTSGTSGGTTISTGSATTGSSGTTQVTTGAVSSGTGTSGNASISTGSAIGGNSGSVSMATGTSSTAASGDITFATGNTTAGTGNSGNIAFNPGSSFGGTKGEIRILGDGTSRSTMRFFNAGNTAGTGLQAPTSSDGTTYTLPGTLGSNGQVIQTDASGVLSFKSVLGSISGDIDHTSFAAANNQASPVDVTGLLFSNAAVRSFEALVSVYIDATTPLYESFKIYGVQKASSWDMTYTSVGDSSGFVFSITNSGQIQYTNNNYAGFVSAAVRFRATVTGV